MWVFKDENGKIYNEAYLDGYDVADRLLEGCFFKITIDNNNKFHASVVDPNNSYYRGLNMIHWTRVMEKHAATNDIFYECPVSTSQQEELFVYDTISGEDTPNI